MTRRGPYAVGTERKAQLVRATERLVLEHGHQNVTMRMVAAAVGVSEAAAYHHFSSRDELLVAVIGFRDEGEGARDVVDLVHHLVTIAAENQRSPHAVELFADMAAKASDRQHPAHAFFADRYARITKTLEEAVLADQRAGRLSTRLSAHATAVTLISLMDGLQTRWLVTPDLDMADHLRQLIDALR
ncbi:TetR family transcriptional regulator [Kineococcus rhizosphaerae]|uniref:TetR family transcriptional regulator n=2 Tax=Kineococcus rhizosphaerae TaxID=559628 RepID=A0A2T0R1Y1_9ACTN|nr:TetR family transcriptional regulator [Kineococcus rhizosphaerae]